MTKAILKVSNNFTSSREKIGDYLENEIYISAYSAFYFPTNFPKFDQIVERVSNLKTLLMSSQVIEIGSGPGSFSFPISKYTQKPLYALETSALMLRQATRFKEAFFNDSSINFVPSISSIPDKSEDQRLVIFTNSFNEMDLAQAYEYIRILDADHVLFIEPGTMETFKALLPMRDKLFRKSFKVLYPCALSQDCPLAQKDDWCHQYLKIDLDLEVKRISQLVKINRKWQAACLHLYSKYLSENQDQTVVLRTFPKTKFSKDWQVCQSNQVTEFSNLKRDYSKEQFKYLDEVLAGDTIRYERLNVLKSGQIRGKVDL